KDLCSDLYYDIEKSPKQKEMFAEFQSLLYLPPRISIRPISNRFIQMLEVCNRPNELLMYWWCTTIVCWIRTKNINTEGFFTKCLRKMSSQLRKRLEVLQQEQVTASRMRTQVNQNQKARITVLFRV
ncbi:hypothetical protein L3Q82_022661, partial [Scortum barcoo]